MRSVKGQRGGDNGDTYNRESIVNWRTVATNTVVIVIVAILTLAATQLMGTEEKPIESRVLSIEQNFVNHTQAQEQRLTDIQRLQGERYDTLLREIKDIKERLK